MLCMHFKIDVTVGFINDTGVENTDTTFPMIVLDFEWASNQILQAHLMNVETVASWWLLGHV